LSISILWLRAKFPIFLTLGLIYFLSGVYVTTFIMEEFDKWATKVLLGGFVVIFLLINISLCRAVRTNPGRVPSKVEWDVETDNIITENEMIIEKRPGEDTHHRLRRRKFRNGLEFSVCLEPEKRANRIVRGMDRDMRKTLSLRYKAL